MLKDIYTNNLMSTDIYNLGHQDFKINTDWEVSYLYNRSAPMILFGFEEIVDKVFNSQITKEMIREAEVAAKKFGVWFPTELMERLVSECDGYFPVEVKAIPDKTWIPQGTPFAQVRNLNKDFGELITWWEAKLIKSWFPSACATRAYTMRKYCLENDYPITKFHDFGYRSHRSEEDAYWSGLSWATYLEGTDMFNVLHHNPKLKVSSIPALAHKVVQQFDDEIDACERAIDMTKARGKKAVSIVIDTYDPWYFIQQKAHEIMIYGSERGIHVVFRPDSGDVLNQAISILGRFHPKYVSVIIGEGMDFEKCKVFDHKIKEAGQDPRRVFYGMGGGFHNDLNRDTLGWAMKTAFSNKSDRMKFSMDRGKMSLPGILDVILDTDGYIKVIPTELEFYNQKTLYKTIWPQPIYTLGDELMATYNQDLPEQPFIKYSDDLSHKINLFNERYVQRL